MKPLATLTPIYDPYFDSPSPATPQLPTYVAATALVSSGGGRGRSVPGFSICKYPLDLLGLGGAQTYSRRLQHKVTDRLPTI